MENAKCWVEICKSDFRGKEKADGEEEMSLKDDGGCVKRRSEKTKERVRVRNRSVWWAKWLAAKWDSGGGEQRRARSKGGGKG